MRIKLNSLHIRNFKNIKDLNIDFSVNTSIYGDNGTGKTSVFDAFTWLLFGKDSADRTGFNIKMLDKSNQPIHHLDHEVSGVILVDDTSITLKRVFREKWVKKRGEAEPVFSGHETVFFINDVPLSQAEYQKRISEIVDENLFKLITSPKYFNEVLSWKERRKILLDMAGKIDAEVILAQLASEGVTVAELRIALEKGKSTDDYKREITAKRKKVADELKLIPSRIDEVGKSMPEAQDWYKIEMGIETRKISIKTIDAQLESSLEQEKQANEKVREHMKKIYFVESQIEDEKARIKREAHKPFAEAKTKLLELEGQANQAAQKVNNTQSLIKGILSGIEGMELRLHTMRKEWATLNAHQADTSSVMTECPTCLRPFSEDEIMDKEHHIIENFNAEKAQRLDKIAQQAQGVKDDIEAERMRLDEVKKQLDAEKDVLMTLNDEVVKQKEFVSDLGSSPISMDSADLSRFNAELEQLKATMPEVDQSFEGQKVALKAEKQTIEQAIKELERKLADRDQIKRLEQRREELLKMEKTMAQEVANLEREEYAILRFTKLQMEAMERSINMKFGLVTFKLFAEQINGGETETCETLIDGVPYSDLNTASRINAGIDIINGLSHHYGVTAPVFVDNRESVVKLIETDSQIINLIVSENDKVLRVA